MKHLRIRGEHTNKKKESEMKHTPLKWRVGKKLKPNAKLSAVAPEMLSALKYLQGWLNAISTPKQEKDMKKFIANIITKAEGE